MTKNPSEKLYAFLSVSVALLLGISSAHALKGVIATPEDVARLKKDALEGKIEIGKTRLQDIQKDYGEAPSILDDDKRVTYDYNDLRLIFERKRIWKSWEYDSFKKPVYTKSVDDLRFDLESKELVGENVTYSMVQRKYGEPTESRETDEDGGLSVYYYGDIKLTFENVISMSSWRGTNLGQVQTQELTAPAISSVSQPSEQPSAAPASPEEAMANQ
jgi:hypothetical protein